MKKILVINGPNLNMLEYREKNIYGDISLKIIQDSMKLHLEKIQKNKKHKINEKSKKIKFEFMQSNFEGEIITAIQKAHFDKNNIAIIINPAAYSHTSIAISDVYKIYKKPLVEVHLSNYSNREDFRKTSKTSKFADKEIKGLGVDSYLHAIDYVINET